MVKTPSAASGLVLIVTLLCQEVVPFLVPLPSLEKTHPIRSTATIVFLKHNNKDTAIDERRTDGPGRPKRRRKGSTKSTAGNPRNFLKEAWEEDFSIEKDSQFADPLDNDTSNYITPYQLQQHYLQNQQQQKQHKDDELWEGEEQPDSLEENPTAIQLDPNEYLGLSQNLGGKDPLEENDSSGENNDMFMPVLDSTNQQMYRSVAQIMAKPAPLAPAAFTPQQSQRGQATENDLMKAWREASPLKDLTSEALHKQVFQDEDGFLKQSKLFRKSLSSNSSEAIREAMAKRYSSAFEARQTSAQTKLEQRVKEMEEVLKSNSENHCCPVCHCIMSPQVWKQSRKKDEGHYICDVCFAEKRLIQRHAGELQQPPTQHMARQHPSSAIRNTPPAFRRQNSNSLDRTTRTRRNTGSLPVTTHEPSRSNPLAKDSRSSHGRPAQGESKRSSKIADGDSRNVSGKVDQILSSQGHGQAAPHHRYPSDGSASNAATKDQGTRRDAGPSQDSSGVSAPFERKESHGSPSPPFSLDSSTTNNPGVQ